MRPASRLEIHRMLESLRARRTRLDLAIRLLEAEALEPRSERRPAPGARRPRTWILEDTIRRRALVWALLSPSEPRHIAALAEVLELRQGAVSKALAALAAEGRAVYDAGGHGWRQLGDPPAAGVRP